MAQEAIPEFLREKFEQQYTKKLAEKIVKGYGQERPVSLRVNTLKTDSWQVKVSLEQNGIACQEVSWSKDALVVEKVREPVLQNLKLYQDGEIYLQSLSSMLPPLIVEPMAGENILDMAAAPGGKTTQMAALSGNMASITACEKNKIRAERLQYNLEKQGAMRVCVMVTDSRKLDDFFSFDKVLLDAPCTGSGTLEVCRRDRRESFGEDLLRRSAKVQEELLLKAFKLLKPGHELVYSTCSILAEENEQVVERVLMKGKGKVIPIDYEAFSGVPFLPVQIEGTLCVCPNEWYEGFFVAKLQKTG
ncbi:RsmB/NOP family class I SAM-dependent RNA methyltransferase [Clostridiaceae bacterium]|nr:RsmB/NOP family class I SAM-dependent RNA methyltransferase [Clostridiaceae bacterium]